MLMQVYHDDISTGLKYVKNAYKVGVSRTTGRFHWNSDTMYGRLFAGMIMPIINVIAYTRDYYGYLCSALGKSVGNSSLPTDSNYSSDFNNLLNRFSDIVSVNSNVKMYLYSMYKKAEEVLNTSNHSFLSQDTYPEVFPSAGCKVNINGVTKVFKYRGTNTKYYYGDEELTGVTRDIIM
jgi:hypothetical protein